MLLDFFVFLNEFGRDVIGFLCAWLTDQAGWAGRTGRAGWLAGGPD